MAHSNGAKPAVTGSDLPNGDTRKRHAIIKEEEWWHALQGAGSHDAALIAACQGFFHGWRHPLVLQIRQQRVKHELKARVFAVGSQHLLSAYQENPGSRDGYQTVVRVWKRTTMIVTCCYVRSALDTCVEALQTVRLEAAGGASLSVLVCFEEGFWSRLASGSRLS